MAAQEQIIRWLFATSAIQVSEPDQPFWYTSGTLGPFYINTHYLFGDAAAARALLDLIDKATAEPLELPRVVAAAVAAQYRANSLYRAVCDLLASQLHGLHLDWISGGERRDYFFSFQTAVLLGKPHLAILKDGRAICSSSEGGLGTLAGEGRLAGATAVHVADLVTEASSYQRTWLPALRTVGARISDSLAVVDRNQGGREFLASHGIRLRTLAVVGEDLFAQAQAAGLINAQQFAQISHFIDNPQKYMDEFLLNHPGFIDSQLAMGGKIRERALQFLEKHPKHLDEVDGYGRLPT